MRLLLFLLFTLLPLVGWAQNEQQVMQLERDLMRVQQEAQAIHQQFQMIQELRRNEMMGSSLADLPDATVESKPLPKYEEMIQQQQEKKDRVERYSADLDSLYAKFNALNEERQAIIEQIRVLEAVSTE